MDTHIIGTHKDINSTCVCVYIYFNIYKPS